MEMNDNGQMQAKAARHFNVDHTKLLVACGKKVANELLIKDQVQEDQNQHR